MLVELRAYLCGWLTVRVGPLTPFVDWNGKDEPGKATYDWLPYFALGAAHGLGTGPRASIPLLSSVAVTDVVEQITLAQRSNKGAPDLERPAGPQCDVIREGRSGVGTLSGGIAIFTAPKTMLDRVIDWLASDGAHARG